MSHHVRISARFRPEPDYGRLARALLQFLEDEAAKAKEENDQRAAQEDGDVAAPPGPTNDQGSKEQP